jgi:hypothetical protein
MWDTPGGVAVKTDPGQSPGDVAARGAGSGGWISCVDLVGYPVAFRRDASTWSATEEPVGGAEDPSGTAV